MPIRAALLSAFLLSGCITVVVPPGDAADGAASARMALEQGQRRTEGRQIERRQQNLDAISNMAVRIASDVQAWSLKPPQFGGGGGSMDGVTLEKLGYQVEGDRYMNLDGSFWLTQEAEGVHVHGDAPAFGHGVTVRVTGSQYTDLALSVRTTGP